MSFNRVLLIGRLGNDPEVRYSQAQNAVGNFRIATNERRQGPDGQWVDHTEWHTIVCFGKTAENCKQYLQKGRQVFVEGKLQTRKYQDQDGKERYFTEVVANVVQFLGGNEGKAANGSAATYMEVEKTTVSSSAADVAMSKSTMGEPIAFDDDDIPF